MAIRVLVVDDDPDVRALLQLSLPLSADIEIVGEAGDGYEALLEAARLEPDLVLMDYMMPEMDGAEATRRLAAAAPGLRVVGFTAFSGETAEEMLEAGAVAVLDKTSVRDLGSRLEALPA